MWYNVVWKISIIISEESSEIPVYTRLHGVTFQKTVMFIDTAVRSLNIK
jgi:hypothetical protein